MRADKTGNACDENFHSEKSISGFDVGAGNIASVI